MVDLPDLNVPVGVASGRPKGVVLLGKFVPNAVG
jgi:hypothetical protein